MNSEKKLNNRLNHLYHSIKKRERLRIGDKQWKIKSAYFWSNKEFKDWYNKQDKVCNYCKITEDQLKQINDLVKRHKSKGKIINKRYKTRGENLEVDRKDDKVGYNKNNCCLACYWCNNAKTDTFTEEEFKPIGKLIGKILRNKIGKKR